jgi:glycosyltransferase involved in cell wall biosynthesis
MTEANRKDRRHILPAREAGLDDFRLRHGEDFRFAPVVAVIAAYNEEESIGAVLEAIGPTACGLDVDVLVIDDGSTDATVEAVQKFEGVRVARLSPNCGHGVALRLGYRLAAEHGAKYVVTLDADMQWDPAEIPTVLAPLVAGEADFVIGSRRLGTAETDDTFRHAGVRAFAWLISTLTGVHVSDTSSGFRAMLTEVTQTVPQMQVQYQTSELLIGAIYSGYRITERPITMHKRLAGESKKGHNLLYGARYARVILTTWARERQRARRAGRQAGR